MVIGMRASLLAVAALGLTGLSGCFAPIDSGACHDDGDCSGAVCSAVGECAATTYRLRVQWTLRGAQANQPGACDGVAELQIVMSDPSTGLEFGVRPVPCSIGSFSLDKMPPSYNAVSVQAYDARGDLMTSSGGSIDPSTGTVVVDLRP